MNTEPKTMNTQENSDEVGIDVQRLVRFSITSCENCPFYAHKYCGLSQRLNAQYGTDYPIFVVNEWKQGIAPTRCPLRNADMVFFFSEQGTAGIKQKELRYN